MLVGTGLKSKLSFSINGEDIFLEAILDKKSGFYIDIGAHHPIVFSNTFKLYQRGWHGINIDGMPGSMRDFESKRKRDINIECVLNEYRGTVDYYIFNQKALNTICTERAERVIKQGGGVLKEKVTLQCYRLEDVLDRYMINGQKIDFMLVDVEGMELQILKSNNWNKYRPEYILCEVLDNEMSIESLEKHSITRYLKMVHYELAFRLRNTAIYREDRDMN